MNSFERRPELLYRPRQMQRRSGTMFLAALAHAAHIADETTDPARNFQELYNYLDIRHLRQSRGRYNFRDFPENTPHTMAVIQGAKIKMPNPLPWLENVSIERCPLPTDNYEKRLRKVGKIARAAGVTIMAPVRQQVLEDEEDIAEYLKKGKFSRSLPIYTCFTDFVRGRTEESAQTEKGMQFEIYATDVPMKPEGRTVILENSKFIEEFMRPHLNDHPNEAYLVTPACSEHDVSEEIEFRFRSR